jgi:hypothetical protein
VPTLLGLRLVVIGKALVQPGFRTLLVSRAELPIQFMILVPGNLEDRLVADRLFADWLVEDRLVADRLVADWLVAGWLFADCLFADRLFADCLFADCLFADCLFTDCLFADFLCHPGLLVGFAYSIPCLQGAGTWVHRFDADCASD